MNLALADLWGPHNEFNPVMSQIKMEPKWRQLKISQSALPRVGAVSYPTPDTWPTPAYGDALMAAPLAQFVSCI